MEINGSTVTVNDKTTAELLIQVVGNIPVIFCQDGLNPYASIAETSN